MEIDWDKLGNAALVFLAVEVVVHGGYWILRVGPKKRLAEEEKARLEREENFSNLSDKFRQASYWLAEQTKDYKFSKDQKINLAEIVKMLSPAQRFIFYKNLVSLMEESFILFYEPKDPEYARMWNTWDDYMNEYLDLPDFKEMLPDLLHGEDSAFSNYITAKITQQPLPSNEGVLALAAS